MGLRRHPRPGGPRGRQIRRRGRGRLMALKTFIEAVRETLADEMRRDDSVIVLGEDVGLKGGVFLATDGLYGEFGDDPVLFFEHKKMYRSVRGDVPAGDHVVPLGKAAITHPGSQITVIAYGLMAHYALEAADVVAEEGVSVEVVDLRTLRPLDKETVLSSVKKTGKCLIVYEDNRFLGYGAEISAIVAEEAFDYLDGPVTRIAGPDVPGVPYNHVLEDWFMVNPTKIADGIRKLAAY